MDRMRTLWRLFLFVALGMAWTLALPSGAKGKALLISDNRQVDRSWDWCFSAGLDLELHRSTVCYDCHLTAKEGLSGDVGRILSDMTMSRLAPDVIFLQLGCNDEPDSDGQFAAYGQTLFDYPSGKVCTTKGANPRTKTIAVSKDDSRVSNVNFAGSLYRIMSFIRKQVPDARVFILSPIAYGRTMTGRDSVKVNQLKTVCHMFCIPFVEDFRTVTDYAFIWNGEKPHIGDVLLLGDSYSELRRWTRQMELRADVSFVNLGKTSATLKERATGNTNTIGNQLTRIPQGINPDIILIEGGTNDEADAQRVVDNYESCVATRKRTTFAGALAYITDNLRKRFPKARIYVVTPGGLFYGHTSDPFAFMVKADQMRLAARMLGLGTVDWDLEGRLSFVFNNSRGTGDGSESRPFLYNVPSRETGDLLHPNDVGAVYLAETVIKTLHRQK